MPTVSVIYGDTIKSVNIEQGGILGEAIVTSGLPLEQPCAGKGTCGLCKVLIEKGASPPDKIELQYLTAGELSINTRLACRTRVQENLEVLLTPILIYSDKVFRASNRYKKGKLPLGLAIDLGSTTVAAFLTTLDNGEVCKGGAALNQQSIYGADVISRLAAARRDPTTYERLHNLALSSINQAIDALRLSSRIRNQVEEVIIVGNVVMHHLIAKFPLDTIAVNPFQPYKKESILDAGSLLGGIFPASVRVRMPPLIGGFVGSDALACLAFFGFEKPPGPMAVIDLGTNGEVMITDGKRILTASTAAGPAFEGVMISCGTRAVDGGIVKVKIDGENILFETIGNEAPVGLTGSGLLSLVDELRRGGVIEPNGRISSEPPILANRIDIDQHGVRRIQLTEDDNLWLTQWDIRELQKAKGAIRATIDTLMSRINLSPDDLERVILTGSFGGQVDISAAIGLGLIPPVISEVVESVPNGAGMGAAMFLSDEGFALGEKLAIYTQQVDLEKDPMFINRYIQSMSLDSNNTHKMRNMDTDANFTL
ncbi:MAG: ASKHA domain-containing protein [Anaerolineales bacterium]